MKHPLTNIRWQAIINNNADYNSKFFYGVTTTKIFCKPACHSKIPNKENVVIFKTAAEALGANFRPCKRCQPTGTTPNSLWIDQIKQYLNNNFQRNLTLEVIAEDCHGSVSNLQRIFKKITGISPTQYLVIIRLNKSQALLCETDYSIKTIANRCGFNSDTYYNTVFKRNFGQTPAEYRSTMH